ncbi:hypothetical protein RDMS_03085 [Deinococcus sp. RL]|nr:hypothetical protein RDMS_03085 [Deinococcus sp. RL]
MIVRDILLGGSIQFRSICFSICLLSLCQSASTARQPSSYLTLRYHSVVGQTSDFTCGPAALATLLTHYYGRPVSEQTFTERSVADMQARGKEVVEGLTLLSLKNALNTENVPSAGYKLTLEQLREVMQAGLPVVANVVYPKGHYYLVLAVDDQNVLLADQNDRPERLPGICDALLVAPVRDLG